MNCSEAKEFISLFIDNELNSSDSDELNKHILNCEQCNKELVEMISLVNELNRMDAVELPENYHDELMDKIRLEQVDGQEPAPVKKVKKPLYKRWQTYGIAAAAAITLFTSISLIGTSFTNKALRTESSGATSAPSAASYRMDSATPANTEEAMSEYSTNLSEMQTAYDIPESEYKAEEQVAQEDEAAIVIENGSAAKISDDSVIQKKKIIYSSNIDLNVDDFDSTIKSLTAFVESSGGYVESSSSYVYSKYRYNDGPVERELKNGTLVLRVPQSAFDSTRNLASQLGSVTNQSMSSQDVTAQYIDTEARLSVKRQEEERLLQLMGKIDSVEEMIVLEQRLSIVRSDIESYESSIRNWDRLVSFSTIVINIYEIHPTNDTLQVNPDFASRFTSAVSESFVNAYFNFEYFLVLFAQNIVSILVFIVSAALVLTISLSIYKRKKRRKDDIAK